jgi:hypothetical protein
VKLPGAIPPERGRAAACEFHGLLLEQTETAQPHRWSGFAFRVGGFGESFPVAGWAPEEETV